MDIFISMSKAEALAIHDYLFRDREKGLAINADGCDFVHTLSWPLMIKSDDANEQRPFMFDSSSVIWFINFVCKLDLREVPDEIKEICHKLADTYVKMLESFIPRDDKYVTSIGCRMDDYLDPDKRPGVDPWEDDDDDDLKSPSATSRPSD